MSSALNFSLLDKLVKICNKKKKKEENENLSLTWYLYSKGAASIIAIGFFVIFSENLLDKNTMQCYTSNHKDNYVNYVVNFCWVHGTFYIEKEFQGIITPCIIHDTNFKNKPVTQYYLWIPYLLAFLFVLARLPYWIWKRYYSNRISSVLKVENSDQLINHFFYYRYLYRGYHLTYSLLESLNLAFLLFSFIFTHIVFNQEFIFYGYDIFKYMISQSEVVHPACHIFPTEVSCRLTVSSPTGHLNETNFLCILSNNLFNQLFFLFLWIYWILILLLSFIGFLYRLMRLSSSQISKYICLRKIKNPLLKKKISNILLKADDWFVFEEILNGVSYIKGEHIVNEICEYCDYIAQDD